MCKLDATGHLTWVSHSEAVLLCWHVYFAGLLMKCKKKYIYSYTIQLHRAMYSESERKIIILHL